MVKLCTQFMCAFMLHILSAKEIGEDTPDTAVPMENNEGQEISVTEQPATTNGELRRDEDKDEEDVHDMLWRKEQDQDLEDTLISVFEGVIGSTKWVSKKSCPNIIAFDTHSSVSFHRTMSESVTQTEQSFIGGLSLGD